MTYLDTPEDMNWLAEETTALAAGYPIAILFGNEDWPTKIELYDRDPYQ